jgi:redox-regulated HSP33 family molecular chaperone
MNACIYILGIFLGRREMYTGTFHVFSEDIFAIALFYFRFSFSLKSRFESKKEESEDQKVSEKNVSRTPGTID